MPISLRRLLAAGILAVSVATLAPRPAAAQVVSPPAFAAAEAPTLQFAITQILAITYQVQFSAAQLGGLVVGQQISGLQFRVDSTEAAQTLTYASYQVVLSQAANTITGMSANPAANQVNPVTVFNGPLTLPGGAMPTGNNPNAFGPTINFSSNYTYQGGDLVIYFSHSASSTGVNSGVGLDADAVNNTNNGYRALFSFVENAPTLGNTGNVVVTQFLVNGNSSAAPEPGTLALLALAGLPVVGAVIRRRKA